LKTLRALGINRLSYGMQSAHPDDLRLLQRIHSFPEVIQAVEFARLAGFDNLNLDLIFGLPFQTLERWQETLERALSLQPDHLSLYALTVEEGTPLWNWVRRGMVAAPDDDLAADMYEWASERLDRGGFGQYEISNWARRLSDGSLRACRHNLQYWRSLPYLGFGAGAHGFVKKIRTANVSNFQEYIRIMQNAGSSSFPAGPAAETSLVIDLHAEMQETMMVGLRLTREGVSRVSFEQRFHQSLESVFGEEIQRLLQVGLLEWAGESLRLTRRGRLLGNQVFMQFVG
jgi:oxygen-independent coproporphyrinogen-3 oxidase